MTDIRYVGTTPWSRTLVKDGEYSGVQIVQPGETVSVSDEVAEKLAGSHTPRHLRVFVLAGSSEDSQSKNYQPSSYEAVQGNASPFPGLDMGSTVQSGRTITRTEDDNPEGHPIGDATQGPQSDNADAVLREEAQQEADKAYQAKREAQKRGGQRQASGESRKSESER